jgi:hypothetical protein
MGGMEAALSVPFDPARMVKLKLSNPVDERERVS